MMYFMSFDEGEPEDLLPLTSSLTKAVDIFTEIASHQACGVGLVDGDGVQIGHWSGYGDGYGDSSFTFIGPEEDHEANALEARRWEEQHRYEQGLRFQL
jgi:hypothetical protein